LDEVVDRFTWQSAVGVGGATVRKVKLQALCPKETELVVERRALSIAGRE